MEKIIVHHKERGFTLLESLFVLSVFFLIISVCMILLKPHHSTLERQLFFTTLKSDLLLAQHHALTSQKLVSVSFAHQENVYYIHNQNGEQLVKRYYNENITVLGGSQRLSFRYHSNGNISTFGSILFYIDHERYSLMFQLGRGRFYVVKEK